MTCPWPVVKADTSNLACGGGTVWLGKLRLEPIAGLIRVSVGMQTRSLLPVARISVCIPDILI